jgi:hypothetical protein
MGIVNMSTCDKCAYWDVKVQLPKFGDRVRPCLRHSSPARDWASGSFVVQLDRTIVVPDSTSPLDCEGNNTAHPPGEAHDITGGITLCTSYKFGCPNHRPIQCE